MENTSCVTFKRFEYSVFHSQHHKLKYIILIYFIIITITRSFPFLLVDCRRDKISSHVNRNLVWQILTELNAYEAAEMEGVGFFSWGSLNTEFSIIFTNLTVARFRLRRGHSFMGPSDGTGPDARYISVAFESHIHSWALQKIGLLLRIANDN